MHVLLPSGVTHSAKLPKAKLLTFDDLAAAIHKALPTDALPLEALGDASQMVLRCKDGAGDLMVISRASDVEEALRNAHALFVAPPIKEAPLQALGGGAPKRGGRRSKPKALTHCDPSAAPPAQPMNGSTTNGAPAAGDNEDGEDYNAFSFWRRPV